MNIALYVLSGAFLVILAASVWLNLKLIYYAKRYYQFYNQLCLDPLGLDYYSPPGTERFSENGKLRVLFYGDSRVVEWPAPGGLHHCEFINRGVSGQTTRQVLLRFDQHVAQFEPDVMVLQVGINDLKTVAIFPEMHEEIVSRCRNNIRQLVERTTALGARVILTSIFPVSRIVPLERRPFWSDAISQAVREVNADLLTLESDRVSILDGYGLLEDRGLVRPEYATDTLHLNARCYGMLNRELCQLLGRLRDVRETESVSA
jgi:lysophospholipase L1-like esterase